MGSNKKITETANSMQETPFFFPGNNYQLYGILHEPEYNDNHTGFIFVHPFAEEKLWAHRVLVNFARFLTREGYTVLRFDFMGHGDSEGNFQDSSVETRLSDIKAALQTIKAKAPQIKKFGLLGLRFGATLAALAAEELTDIRKLILWEPILEGDKYMQQILRSNLATQNAVYKKIRYTREQLIQILKEGKTVNFDGYDLSYPFFEQISAINLTLNPPAFHGETLIVQIDRVKKGLNKKLTALKDQYHNAEQILAVEEPFWKETKYFCSQAEDLYHNTYNWLLNHAH
jgi:exosortase A-associated hydrolase 2